jgi:hypothetical protein
MQKLIEFSKSSIFATDPGRFRLRRPFEHSENEVKIVRQSKRRTVGSDDICALVCTQADSFVCEIRNPLLPVNDDEAASVKWRQN